MDEFYKRNNIQYSSHDIGFKLGVVKIVRKGYFINNTYHFLIHSNFAASWAVGLFEGSFASRAQINFLRGIEGLTSSQTFEFSVSSSEVILVYNSLRLFCDKWMKRYLEES